MACISRRTGGCSRPGRLVRSRVDRGHEGLGALYFTGWTAAGHWALTNQVFRTTVLKSSARILASAVRLLDQDCIVQHVPEHALAWALQS